MYKLKLKKKVKIVRDDSKIGSKFNLKSIKAHKNDTHNGSNGPLEMMDN